MKNMNTFAYNHGITHGGIFHADDAFSTALCLLLNPSFTWKRVFQVPADIKDNTIVYDIGNGMYDHHQVGKRIRTNGVPYAAFGLLWEAFGHMLVPNQEDRDSFDAAFVQPLDAGDNGYSGIPDSELSRVIADFNPDGVGVSNSDRDSAFAEAVAFAKVILANRFKRINSVRSDMDYVQEFMEEGKDILVLPEFHTWQVAVVGSDYKYVVYPSERGGYNVQGVPVSLGSFDTVCPFPKEWCGLRGADLAAVTGVKGSVFCHASGFLSVANTLEEALQLAELSLAQG